MSCATPILYLNMGGEMLYVLQQRLHTQRIRPDKTIQVMNDVIRAFLDPKQLQLIFHRDTHMHMSSLRSVLEKIILSSIMKLDLNSMNKLFDLMIMMVKYQLDTATGPREVILLTLNHIDAVRDMAVDKTLHVHINLAHELLLNDFGNMRYKKVWEVRKDCLNELEHHNVRVSILLKLGLQNNDDASFNRMFQKYNEHYEEKKDELENMTLLEHLVDQSSLGSLLLNGKRVTLLGKNLYSNTCEQMPDKRYAQNVPKASSFNNNTLRQELRTLSIQLGKEDVSLKPISLHLFTDDELRAEYDSNREKFKDPSSSSDVAEATPDEESTLNRNESVYEYRNKLIDNVSSDFADIGESGKELLDLTKMLDSNL